ncbi:MAG TPA: 4-hydroxy-tetrahydrodipicolinate reductase [bacterium]|nr:4-hydroxy-tetrahydrodipicolinate reductase [bacterium]
MKKIRVVVSGAYGRMGREVVRAITAENDLELVGAFDSAGVGCDTGEITGIGANGIRVDASLNSVLKNSKPDVVVDFTTADGFEKRASAIMKSGARLVTGTTGLSDATLKKLEKQAGDKKTGVVIAANFAIGAVLMMQFAEKAARYLPDCEIIELHHDKKLDAPSGTALATAEKIAAAGRSTERKEPTKTVKLDGARGGDFKGVSVHSVRLPGYVASQEVIFGAQGQTLKIRHDTISRESFMPGVVLAVRKVMRLKKMVTGLESLL